MATTWWRRCRRRRGAQDAGSETLAGRLDGLGRARWCRPGASGRARSPRGGGAAPTPARLAVHGGRQQRQRHERRGLAACDRIVLRTSSSPCGLPDALPQAREHPNESCHTELRVTERRRPSATAVPAGRAFPADVTPKPVSVATLVRSTSLTACAGPAPVAARGPRRTVGVSGGSETMSAVTPPTPPSPPRCSSGPAR